MYILCHKHESKKVVQKLSIPQKHAQIQKVLSEGVQLYFQLDNFFFSVHEGERGTKYNSQTGVSWCAVDGPTLNSSLAKIKRSSA